MTFCFRDKFVYLKKIELLGHNTVIFFFTN